MILTERLYKILIVILIIVSYPVVHNLLSEIKKEDFTNFLKNKKYNDYKNGKKKDK